MQKNNQFNCLMIHKKNTANWPIYRGKMDGHSGSYINPFNPDRLSIPPQRCGRWLADSINRTPPGQAPFLGINSYQPARAYWLNFFFDPNNLYELVIKVLINENRLRRQLEVQLLNKHTHEFKCHLDAYENRHLVCALRFLPLTST